MEPVEIRTDELPPRPADTHAVHRAPQHPMTGLRPGVSGRTGQWTAAPAAPDPIAPGREVAPFVRRQAAVFGGDRPTPAAGPVTPRPPDGLAAQVAAYRDPDVDRWYGVVADEVAG